jgi:hypothetical protein
MVILRRIMAHSRKAVKKLGVGGGSSCSRSSLRGAQRRSNLVRRKTALDCFAALAMTSRIFWRIPIDFNDQLRRYFASDDLAAITPDAMQAGIEHMLVDLGLEQSRERRFALWSLLYMLGAAPDLDVAFKDAADRDAARDFMALMERADPPSD